MDPNPVAAEPLELAVPVGVAVIGALAVLPWLLQGNGKAALAKFPLVGAELGSFEKRRKQYLESALNVHNEGYEKHRDMPYRITEPSGELLVMPIRYLEELRKLPDAAVDHVVSIDEVLQKEHLGLSINNPIVGAIVRGELTRALPSITKPLWEEVQRTIPEFLGTSSEWKPICVNDVMLQIVAIVSGTVFVGPELGRSPIYLDASIQYTVDLFTTAGELRAWPKLIRPLAAKFLVPGVKKVLGYRERVREFLKPHIEERKQIAADGGDVPNDALQWMITKSDKVGVTSVGDIADAQLMLSLGAIHTTTMAAVHLFYDLAGNDPSIISALQTEIKTVLAEHDGVLTAQALQQMKLLDSTLRESQRVNTNSLVQFTRHIHKDTTLSDGTLLPAGTSIAVPTFGVSHDGAYYPNPETFDPFRFANIREGKADDPLKFSNKEQYQFVSVTKENTNFGFGRHACPGRFFAAHEIKLIVIKILLEYEFKMPEGMEGKRYDNLLQVSQLIPDPTKELLFRYVGQN